MYVPSHFEETRTDVMHALIRAHGLGTLVTLDDSGLNANHIPFEIEAEGAGAGEFGVLRAHVARANPVWKNLSSTVDAMVVFQGAQAYITPSWYETKKADGKVVPTYNYISVHAYGELRAIDDRAWLRQFVGRLTDRYEASRTAPWAVSDAPEEYIEKLLGAIVGIEIPIKRLVGKWKVSQNRPAADRVGIIDGLTEAGSDDARAMARAVGR
ncbi:MAG TPA: FMN-binding negative transcriptional regulator [Burkholderiaceae bacterium]